MILSEYLASIQELIEDRPELLEAEVIYATDNEGAEYYPCQFSATAGNYDGEYIEESDEDFHEEMQVNAVCIN